MRLSKISALGAMALGLGFAAVPKADAAYIAYLYQDGANVVATGSGSINLTDLTYVASAGAPPSIGPADGLILNQPYDIYSGIVGPTSLGTGGYTFASAAKGPGIAICLPAGGCNPEDIAVPQGYTSGTAIAATTATWDNTTLSALGVTDGPYVWTWGTGANADSFTLNIGTSPVPEPASLAVLGVGLLGLVISRRRAA